VNGEFGVPGVIADFDRPLVLIVPKTKVVSAFLDEYLSVDIGLPRAI
jgi:hypothetical protein